MSYSPGQDSHIVQQQLISTQHCIICKKNLCQSYNV